LKISKENKMKPIKFEFVPPSPLPPSPLPEKTVIALLKLKAFVLAEPRRYDQGVYLATNKNSMTVRFQKPLCGTVACLAGSAVIMEGYIPSIRDSMRVKLTPRSRKYTYLTDAAREILGINEDQAGDLFTGRVRDYWCREAANALDDAESMLQYADEDDEPVDNFPAFQARAEAAAMEIDHFIATGNVGDDDPIIDREDLPEIDTRDAGLGGEHDDE
jgi:hypothetical protein